MTLTANQDGTFTLTLSNRERTAVDRTAASRNDTSSEWLRRHINRLISNEQDRLRQEDAVARQDAYDAATNAVKNQIDDLLGL